MNLNNEKTIIGQIIIEQNRHTFLDIIDVIQQINIKKVYFKKGKLWAA